MASKIQVRRDTLSNWNANNPVLSSGEIAFVTDENKFKVGNGSTAFSSLPYLQADAYIDSVILGTDTTGNYVETMISGDGISLSGQGSESASVTVTNTGVLSLAGTANEVEVSASTGNITVGLPSTINANTTGSAATLTNARAIALGGDLSGSASFDGSASITITADIQPNSVVLGTDTTGNYVASASAGTGISITGSGSEDAAITIANTGVISLAGTVNQISVSASNGDSTISFPSAVTFPGSVTLNANPSQALQAATKQYVDEVAEGLRAKPAVEIATTANLGATYDNGTLGVGATLTASANGAFPEIDGVTLTSTTPGSNGVLVKNQTNAAQNGRYNLTQVGDSENPWILTRCGLCDQSDEIAGTYYFVKRGTLGAGTGWTAVVDDPATFVIGTDDIDLFQFSGAGTYTAGTGLSLNGTQFSNTGVLSLTGTTNEIEVSASSGSITIGLPNTITAGILLPTSDTATTASHYIVETASDGILRPKTLANVRTEIVTTAAVNSAAATTVGTVTSGTWAATDIGLAHGGTNASLTATNGAVVYSTASALALTGVGTAGQVLTSNGAGAPTWQEPPSSGFDGFFLSGM